MAARLTVDAVARCLLLDPISEQVPVEAELRKAFALRRSRGLEQVPADVVSAAQLGVLQQKLIGVRKRPNLAAHAYRLICPDQDWHYTEVISQTDDGTITHFAVNQVGRVPIRSGSVRTLFEWNIKASVRAKLTMFGFLPSFGASKVTSFEVLSTRWAAWDKEARCAAVARVKRLASDFQFVTLGVTSERPLRISTREPTADQLNGNDSIVYQSTVVA